MPWLLMCISVRAEIWLCVCVCANESEFVCVCVCMCVCGGVIAYSLFNGVILCFYVIYKLFCMAA